MEFQQQYFITKFAFQTKKRLMSSLNINLQNEKIHLNEQETDRLGTLLIAWWKSNC